MDCGALGVGCEVGWDGEEPSGAFSDRTHWEFEGYVFLYILQFIYQIHANGFIVWFYIVLY